MDNPYIKGFINALRDAICGIAVGILVVLGLATYSATSITSLTEYEYTFCSLVAFLAYLGLVIQWMIKNIRYQLLVISDVEGRANERRIIEGEERIRLIDEELQRREELERRGEENMSFLRGIELRLHSYKERADHFSQSHNMGYGDSSDEVRTTIEELNTMQNELQMSSHLDEFRGFQLKTLHHIKEKLRFAECWSSISEDEIFRLELQTFNTQIIIDLFRNCIENIPSDEVRMFDAEHKTMLTLNKRFMNQFEILKSIEKDLPFITISAHHVEEVGKCAICTDDFVLGEEAVEMPCHPGHIFHCHCIEPWLLQQSTCPTCRM